jgi:hypothetical protein
MNLHYFNLTILSEELGDLCITSALSCKYLLILYHYSLL